MKKRKAGRSLLALALALALCFTVTDTSGFGQETDDSCSYYALTLTQQPGGTLSVDGMEGDTGEFALDEEVKVILSFETECRVVDVSVMTDDGGRIEYQWIDDDVFSFVMPDADVYVTASFYGATKEYEAEQNLIAERDKRLADADTDSSAEKVYGKYTTSEWIDYGNWRTRLRYVDGVKAYCVQPSRNGPPGGSYEKHYNVEDYIASSSESEREAAFTLLENVLWVSAGAPGFDESYWPNSWYDNSGMSDNKYYVLTHILAADIYSQSASAALYGTSDAFRNYCSKYLLDDGGSDTVSTREKIEAAMAKTSSGTLVPLSFKIFVLVINGYQDIVSWDYKPAYLTLAKASSNTDITDDNGCYSLGGAVYGVYESKSDAENDSNCLVQMTTVEDGSSDTVELYAGTYYVKEIDAPRGYALDRTVYSVTLTMDNTYTLSVSEVPQSNPINIFLAKIDRETGSALALGAATLEGAQFAVNYYDGYYDEDPAETGVPATRQWVFETDEEGMIYFTDEYKISGDDFYYDSGGDPVLPLGTVTIQETKAPPGYLLNDDVILRQVTSSGTEEAVYTYEDPVVEDQVKRGDFEFDKKNDSYENMTQIPFLITSATTGESHLVWTDENGYYSTESDFYAHSLNTNSGEPESGVWFGLDADGNSVETDDSLGALPYDTYYVQEQSCDANVGMTLRSFIVVISRDSYTVQEGTIVDENEAAPTLWTYAMVTGSDGEKNVEAGEVSITDVLYMTGLTVGETYYVYGVAAEEDGTITVDADGEPVELVASFVAEDSDMVWEGMVFTFNASNLAGDHIVFEEYLYADEGLADLVAEEEDLRSLDQSIYVNLSDGSGDVSSIIKTGDSGRAMMYGFITAAAAAACGGVCLYRRRRKI